MYTKTTPRKILLLISILLFLKILPFTHSDLKAQVSIKDNFGLVPVVDGQLTEIGGPTAMDFLPGGRIIICEKDGKVQLVKNGKLLQKAVFTFKVETLADRALMGVAV